MTRGILTLGFISISVTASWAAPLNDEALQNYFTHEVARIEASSLADIDSREEWQNVRGKLRAELFEMLGVDPQRERGDLRAEVTGKVEREEIVVEKLHFQSSPGLYVTANFYRPAKVDKPLPTILYVCGHGQVKTNGVSYGNKVAYQHHGAWFARNGYTCLTIDTIQLGEIEGKHHGTYREGMWWWNSRGYTPAGVEAWNCIRALDYLETRPEVDKSKFGVTGRSGGGAYSWWIAALDDRIKVAAPVAGITDLRDHVVDGVVEGHCDCMYFVNTYQWDYPMVAALVAPRPLLIANSDKDTIFPLDGVVRTHSAVAKIYGLLGSEKNLGLLITEGPHKDTQDLQLPVFRWFNKHLKGEDPVVDMAATKLFSAEELKVFEKLPEDEITSKVHETFVPAWNGKVPKELTSARVTELRSALRERVFSGWPESMSNLISKTKEAGGQIEVHFHSQEDVRLRLVINGAEKPGRLAVLVLEEGAQDSRSDDWLKERSETRAVLFVRGPKTTAVDKERSVAHLRRRYMLVGQTLDTMRIWDILAAREFLRSKYPDVPVEFTGAGPQAGNIMLARIMNSDVRIGDLSHHDANEMPDHLNLLRFTTWEEIERIARWPELF